MRLVVVESPYMFLDQDPGERAIGQLRNVTYARLALRDCLLRGESPIASHLLLTQPNVLDDDVPAERTLGIEAGLEWAKKADASVFYLDLGVSRGMTRARQAAHEASRPTLERRLPGWENALVEDPSVLLCRLGLFTEAYLEDVASSALQKGHLITTFG